MIEVVIFIVVIFVAVAGVLQVINFTTSHSADPQLRKQALVLAEGCWKKCNWPVLRSAIRLDPAAETAASTGVCTVPQTFPTDRDKLARPYYNVTDYVSKFDEPLRLYPGRDRR